MSQDLQDKIAKLPVWVREYIRHLEIKAESVLQEAARQRQRIEHLEKANRKLCVQMEAMVAMFQCAAKGGNEIAQAVQRQATQLATLAAENERRRSMVAAWVASWARRDCHSQEESDAVAKMDAALAAAARELEGT